MKTTKIPFYKKINHSKISGVDTILIPRRIASKCIKNAKTPEAKEILVRLTEQITIEHMKRIHLRGYAYEYKSNTKAYEKPVSIKDTVKLIWNSIFSS